ncbi:MAG TPA: NINE protein [Candidatus Saccharimonadales bacterium]
MYPNQDPVQPIVPQPDPTVAPPPGGVVTPQPVISPTPETLQPQQAAAFVDPLQQMSAAPQPQPAYIDPLQQQYQQPPQPQPVPLAAMPAFMQPPDPAMQQTDPYAGAGLAPSAAAGENLDKSYLVTLLLSYFVGGLGVDRFYLGHTKSAILKLVTFGGLGVWSIIDVLLVAFGKLTAKDDPRPLEGFAKEFHWVKIVAIVIIVFNVLLFLGFVLMFIITGMMTVNKL